MSGFLGLDCGEEKYEEGRIEVFHLVSGRLIFSSLRPWLISLRKICLKFMSDQPYALQGI